MNHQDANPFRSPSALDSRKQERSFIYMLACLLWCGLAIKMIILRPVVLSLFEDFELELPGLTIWLLHPALTVFFVVIAVGLLLSGLIIGTSEGRRRIGRRALLLALVTIILLMTGLGFPLIQLIRSL